MRAKQTRKREGDRRGEVSECRGHCQVQTYQFDKNAGTKIEKNSGDCPDLKDEEIRAFLKANLKQDVTLVACVGGNACLCKPHKVSRDDPSWGEAVSYKIRERTLRKQVDMGPDQPVLSCVYTISGTVDMQSRIDNEGICYPDPSEEI
ncbi:MAG: hypothetical protein ACRENT_00725 [Thermodesulfobacteriota bacterium]